MKNKQDGVGTQNHYTAHGIEPIDYIVANQMNFLEGNVVKYVTRYKLKNGLEDLQKAQQYLTWLIDDETEKELDKVFKLNATAGKLVKCHEGESIEDCTARCGAAEVKNATGQNVVDTSIVYQYYYRVNSCPAESPNDFDCICWHDEGTGNHVKEKQSQVQLHNALTWRKKPK